MVYLRNEPVAGDDLDVSQPKLASNTNASDDSFGIDHYKYSDLTVNNGFHNTVTQPLIIGSAHPTTTTNPVIYAMQDWANIGLLQYSRGTSNAKPTPLTFLQSPLTPLVVASGGTTNVLDFAGQTVTACILSAWNSAATVGAATPSTTFVYYYGSLVLTQILAGQLVAQASGSVLQIRNLGGNCNNLYWSLQFLRIT